MKKVTAFVASARKKHTYNAAAQFLSNVQSMGDIEVEIVRLSDYRLQVCRGCKACCDKGEEHCPLKNDRDLLIEKMMTSDGVVFASPNYSFQVSAMMKMFLDRLGFAFHRPRFFGKTFTSIVAQGIYGGRKIVDYLDFVGHGSGFGGRGQLHRHRRLGFAPFGALPRDRHHQAGCVSGTTACLAVDKEFAHRLFQIPPPAARLCCGKDI